MVSALYRQNRELTESLLLLSSLLLFIKCIIIHLCTIFQIVYNFFFVRQCQAMLSQSEVHTKIHVRLYQLSHIISRRSCDSPPIESGYDTSSTRKHGVKCHVRKEISRHAPVTQCNLMLITQRSKHRKKKNCETRAVYF